MFHAPCPNRTPLLGEIIQCEVLKLGEIELSMLRAELFTTYFCYDIPFHFCQWRLGGGRSAFSKLFVLSYRPCWLSLLKLLLFVLIYVKVNGCAGEMGRTYLKHPGLQPIPVCFSGPEDEGKTVEVGRKEITVHDPSDRENIMQGGEKELTSLLYGLIYENRASDTNLFSYALRKLFTSIADWAE
ncbi:hypothetical protein RND71_035024 [Anisodus tanguticus]|uniref:Uncharacterized protein n=1 Tax=Anisodus tanguticus TaxID=243964 RepID=A0AAE1R4C0_9SOLA|nr:hypothetical protein RND71_035024 [Anisodus tanguticus]